uniref:Protein AAR2 homolog n=1 Tax=Lygus hesperus TaxID=30085 RepID=A0A0A9Y7M7_LYGHE
MEMDQETAKRLLVEGSTLIILNVPVGTEFGIDMKTWNTGEKFMGIKMIPPGIHNVYYSPTNKHGDVAPRVSFMQNFGRSEFVVKKWDVDAEGVSSDIVSAEDVKKMKDDIQSLDQFLGVYPYDTYEAWKKLSEHITPTLLKKLTPECGLIRSALDLVCTSKKTPPAKRTGRSRTFEQREEELLPELTPLPGTGIRFSPVPENGFPPGSTPQEITKHSLDQSYTLDLMINKSESAISLVGELQFTFICFFLGHSLEALEAWRSMVQLFCKCQNALVKRKDVYLQFLRALESQLNHIPEDFLVDIVASNNVIYTSLRELFQSVSEINEVDGRFKCLAERMQHRLTEKFGWDFENLEIEDGEDAPVIVDLGPIS